MYTFTQAQQQKALFWLIQFHILIIAASNYLVQFPFDIFGVHTTWGAFTFPFIFLATDLTVRIFGSQLARRIIFWVMFPALLLSYIVSVLFSNGAWTGWASLTQFSTFVGRIALASFCAYALGQILDIFVFNKLRRLPSWWIAPTASIIAGNALDTLMFFSVAFYASSDPFMAAHWPGIAFVDYLFKLTICTLFFLPAYGLLLNLLTKKLTTLSQTRPIAETVEQNV
ncbi:7-cyano-7-deazaguanine/7-aminomethyl-7-deazaguanine transporter [Neisseria sp. ZJ106]|uniref:Probable queuosine precursor transporter n=1 Tax=Neisseria lisongii TaxID=2912188 RepID=A0AAW5AST9_9NEIS|nr:7-cyano-7-deazaguanine/7-aminomethyl-7-deazaguanine transporter [Neisseria lisongii]MCF7522121.1 7-cyano-7-deazaguanine/7-aminomethyl-7-deazaguanine transporter [Neisseria lisongii]MCF7530065.1 7-cyano-7-deazaguanine/7-aminomethyl-7-deazaguanine transporter [Neisseria lisongii]WCL71108.1 7-cyano-7-deazaguanine/7-aminomethyl-7-deazaguanine transporter [Neisseria lisongii]